jgi:hypothetical protein
MRTDLLRYLMAAALRKLFNFLGYAGVILILYGVVSTVTQSTWPPLDHWIVPASAFLTLLGVILTAASVYRQPTQLHPPATFSVYVSAPAVILGCTAAIGVLLWRGSLPPVIVNGFSMLGIAGALFRLQRRPTDPTSGHRVLGAT